MRSSVLRRCGVPFALALTVATAVVAADPPADNDPGSDIFDMRKRGSVVPPAVPDPSTQPASTPPDPTPAPPPPPTPPAPPAAADDGREPVPPAADVAAAAKQARDVYASELAAAARSTEARLALADKVLAAAAEEAIPANRFALLDLARDTAAAAGDLRLAGVAADRQAARFRVDADKLKAAAATVVVRAQFAGSAERRFALLRVATLSDALSAGGRGDLAATVDAALAAAAAVDPPLASQVKVSTAAHVTAAGAAAAAAKGRAVLVAHPADPRASEAVGRYECLTAGDWAAGVPHLAAGADPLLRAAAVADAGGQSSAEARIAAGDAWRAAAGPAAGPDRSKLLGRAAHWYALAAATSAGLSRDKAQARQRDLAGAAVPAAAAAIGPPRVVDLLALADPGRDVVNGSWTLAGAGLASGDAKSCRLELPYRPPAEYDLRVTFTRTSGNDALDVIGLVGTGGRQFAYTLAGWANTVSGLAMVGGHGADDNATTVRQRAVFDNGRRHTLVVEVRVDHVRATLDGSTLGREYRTDGRDLRMHLDEHLHRRDTLGLNTCRSVFDIHSADLVAVPGGGPGRAVTADDADDSPIVAKVMYTCSAHNYQAYPVTLRADGTARSPDGEGTWYVRGNAVAFRWGEYLDQCTMAVGRRSFAGKNGSGLRVSGNVTSGSL